MAYPKRFTPSAVVLIATVAGVLIASILGLLTFGAQATVHPDGVPVAIAVADGPAATQLKAAALQVPARAGEQLDVRMTPPSDARSMLLDKEVYGVLELSATEEGPAAKVVVSGAVNPTGTQVAQQALTSAGQGLLTGIAQQTGGTAGAVQVEQIHPASPAGRAAPLALSALAWIGCMVAGAALTVLGERNGSRVGAGGRILTGVAVSVLLTGALAGFLRLWDAGLPLAAEVVGMILLTTLAFVALQAGVFHWLGIKAMAILAPLYLIAPAVASQVPEILHPWYRNGLWSWTPFRFPTEALRSLLNGTPDAPDVMLAVWVLGGMLVVGALLLALPRPSAGEEAEPDGADRIVDIGVDEADRLPSA